MKGGKREREVSNNEQKRSDKFKRERSTERKEEMK
jgi:hypothetical protein